MVTNQKLNSFSLRQIAEQVHTSMARAIHPFHTMTDGDVFFAVTTDEIENPNLTEVDLGVIASELAWDAVLSMEFQQLLGNFLNLLKRLDLSE